MKYMCVTKIHILPNKKQKIKNIIKRFKGRMDHPVNVPAAMLLIAMMTMDLPSETGSPNKLFSKLT